MGGCIGLQDWDSAAGGVARVGDVDVFEAAGVVGEGGAWVDGVSADTSTNCMLSHLSAITMRYSPMDGRPL
jgi:hypothetical protein